MRRTLSIFLAVSAICFLLSGCMTSQGYYQDDLPDAAPEEKTLLSPEHSLPTEAEPVPTPEAIPTPEPVPERYEFGVPLEASEPLTDDSYFENAVFLGDSRTEGLELFGGLKNGTFYWARGMTVFYADDVDGHSIFDVDGEQLTLVGTLSKRSYDAVYIMIGVNELGYTVEQYEDGLRTLIDKVLAAQPDAVVYLQIMPPVNDAVCQKSGLAYYINNDNIKQFNDVIIRVAEEKQVVLLNTAEAYTGEDGQLPAELASDGCHFAYSAYSLWADYLRTHIIDKDLYFSSRAQKN